MFYPIPGGSTQRIEFDEEHIDVHLPPVGYVIDKVPDPKTGRPSEKLIKSEILFDDLPLVDKKWTKTKLPKNWDKLLEDEKLNQQINPKYTNRDADEFRAQEWRRRLNGVWIAIGNNKKEAVEYVYLTGFMYFYMTWWDNGYTVNFRFVMLRIFYALAWAEENPSCYGLVLSTLRRLGKTAIAYCYLYEAITRGYKKFGGSQAQTKDDAQEFFIKFLIGPFLKLPDFFRPIYEDSGELKNGISFKRKVFKGKKAHLNFIREFTLEGDITFAATKSNAYDKSKLHRYIVEEPGKWETESIYETYNKVKPALKNGHLVIGKAFLPTTVEELGKGGDEFVDLFEDSLPSKMKINDGETKSGLISLFIPAYDGFIFDQYGRSVVDDPDKSEELYDDLEGKRIVFGAKTLLLKARKKLENDPAKLAIEIRQYPWSWEEAKSMANEFCHFNHMAITKQLQYLRSLPKKPWIKGNLDWIKGKDSDVDFNRDDNNGRFKFTWLPDEKGSGGEVENGRKILNNVREEWDSENERKLFFPKNDHLFAIGGDPIRNVKTDDPTASKAAFYAFRKFDASVDKVKYDENGKPDHSKWQSHSFFVEYLIRPEDPEVFHEDMIMLCRFLGCSVLPEDNVETFRQYFDMRGYGGFILYRGDFDDNALPGVKKEDNYADKPLRTDDVVVHNGVNKINMYFKYDISRFLFESALESCLKFRIEKHYRQDAVMGMMYTLFASESSKTKQTEDETGKIPIEMQLFPIYQIDGDKSREMDLHEFNFQ